MAHAHNAGAFAHLIPLRLHILPERFGIALPNFHLDGAEALIRQLGGLNLRGTVFQLRGDVFLQGGEAE